MAPPAVGQLVVVEGDGRPVILTTQPGDLFARLMHAIEEVGEISFVDRESEIIGGVLNLDGYASAQLHAEIARTDGDPQVQFTLETLTAGNAPDLGAVVHQISAHL